MNVIWYELVWVFIFGSLWGSFANVVIHRLPLGESVVSPRSKCPNCRTQLRWYQNIPILSFLILRGRCGFCRAHISCRYPIVETLVGGLFVLAWIQFSSWWTIVEMWWLSFALVTCSCIDLDHYILPDKITLPGIGLGLLVATVSPERSTWDSVSGFLLGGGFLWATAYLYWVLRGREGMGGGDIKLLAWMGSVLGWMSVPFVILVASILGTFGGFYSMFCGTRDQDGPIAIPFGPYLAAASLLYALGNGSTIVQLYWEFWGFRV